MDQITALKVTTHNTNLKCGSYKLCVSQSTSNTSVNTARSHLLGFFLDPKVIQYMLPPQKMSKENKEYQKTDLQSNYMTNLRLNIKAILYHFKYHQIN